MKNNKKVIVGIIILLALLLFGGNLVKKHKAKNKNEIKLSENNIMADKSNKQQQQGDVTFIPTTEQNDKRDSEKKVINKSNEENTESHHSEFDPDVDFKSNFSINESYESNKNGTNNKKESNTKNKTQENNRINVDDGNKNKDLNDKNNANKDLNFLPSKTEKINLNKLYEGTNEFLIACQTTAIALNTTFNQHRSTTGGECTVEFEVQDYSNSYKTLSSELDTLCNFVDNIDVSNNKASVIDKFNKFKSQIKSYKDTYKTISQFRNDKLAKVNNDLVTKCDQIFGGMD